MLEGRCQEFTVEVDSRL